MLQGGDIIMKILVDHVGKSRIHMATSLQSSSLSSSSLQEQVVWHKSFIAHKPQNHLKIATCHSSCSPGYFQKALHLLVAVVGWQVAPWIQHSFAFTVSDWKLPRYCSWYIWKRNENVKHLMHSGLFIIYGLLKIYPQISLSLFFYLSIYLYKFNRSKRFAT